MDSPTLSRMEEKNKRVLEFVADAPERVEPNFCGHEHGNPATLVQRTGSKVSHLLLSRLMLHDG